MSDCSTNKTNLPMIWRLTVDEGKVWRFDRWWFWAMVDVEQKANGVVRSLGGKIYLKWDNWEQACHKDCWHTYFFLSEPNKDTAKSILSSCVIMRFLGRVSDQSKPCWSPTLLETPAGSTVRSLGKLATKTFPVRKLVTLICLTNRSQKPGLWERQSKSSSKFRALLNAARRRSEVRVCPALGSWPRRWSTFARTQILAAILKTLEEVEVGYRNFQ